MKRSNQTSLNIRSLVFVVLLALVGTELIVSAQNTNSGTTMQNDNTSTQSSNTSGAKTNRRRGNRSGSGRKVVGFPKGQTSTDMQNAELERTTGRPEDLTGQSYNGTVNYPGGNLSGPAKLEFLADNQFSLTPEGGQAMTGRYYAVTTRGYTGVTMIFGTPSSATPATIVSVRLKKVGNGVQIMNVPEETKQFSFTASGSGTGGRGARRHRAKAKQVAIKPPTVMNNNAR